MPRLLLALACFAVASVAIAAPVPKTIRPEPIRLSGPRPLMIRMAVVKDGELKLTQDDREPDSVPIRDVTATDRDGKPLDSKTLTAKLTEPTLVVVTTYERANAHGKDAPKVDDGNDWRRVLADDVIVIDGKAFKYGWWDGTCDVRLDPVRVDGQKVATTSISTFGLGPNRTTTTRESVHTLDPAELLEVDVTEWAEWVRWNEQRGVSVFFRSTETPDEHRKLFRDFYFGGKTPHFRRSSSNPLSELAGKRHK